MTRLLLTGDVLLTDEAAIVAREPALRAEWMAVPHHGSRSSSSALLLDTLGASSAVAQAGYRNRFRHPDAEVIARYQLQNRFRFFAPITRVRCNGASRARVKHGGVVTPNACTLLA